MNFRIYNIQSPILKPYIQYILFSYAEDNATEMKLKSFANNNYCLGIVINKKIEQHSDGTIRFTEKPGINSYITGNYLNPFETKTNGWHDEICIDFTPLGYHHFFRFPPKTYMLQEDVLTEAFGKKSYSVFEKLFDEKSLSKRGKMIEELLCKSFLGFSNSTLEEAIHLIHGSNGATSLTNLCTILKQPEKKIYRLFKEKLDVSPKEYMRICRFRHSLSLLKNGNTLMLTNHAYESGFYDQCHFIKETKFFTGVTPKLLSAHVQIVQDKVWFGK
jgi:AraC-like DNA-binding protein